MSKRRRDVRVGGGAPERGTGRRVPLELRTPEEERITVSWLENSSSGGMSLSCGFEYLGTVRSQT